MGLSAGRRSKTRTLERVGRSAESGSGTATVLLTSAANGWRGRDWVSRGAQWQIGAGRARCHPKAQRPVILATLNWPEIRLSEPLAVLRAVCEVVCRGDAAFVYNPEINPAPQRWLSRHIRLRISASAH